MKISFFKKTFSILIITTVFFSTALSTFLILEVGIQSSTSNTKLISKFINKESATTIAGVDIQKEGEQIGMSTTAGDMCHKVWFVEDGNQSIVDFLKVNQIDPSFSSRQSLAEKVGIENYVGSEKQNNLLKEYLLSKNKNDAPCI